MYKRLEKRRKLIIRLKESLLRKRTIEKRMKGGIKKRTFVFKKWIKNSMEDSGK